MGFCFVVFWLVVFVLFAVGFAYGFSFWFSFVGSCVVPSNPGGLVWYAYRVRVF